MNEVETSKNYFSKNIKILLFCLVFGTGIAYFFSNPTPKNYYDYTFRVAENFLHGKIGFSEPQPSWLNEFVPYNDEFYSVFPLGSVLTMLPFALLKFVGVVEEMPAAFIVGLTASAICFFLLLISTHYNHTWRRRILLAAAILFGTWAWTNLTFGGAWQLALGFAMLGEFGAIYFTVYNRKPILAGIFFALAFGNRTEIVLTAPIFMYLLCRDSVDLTSLKKPILDWLALARFCAVPFVLGISTLIYNYLRFDSFFDFGYARIPGVLDEPWYNHGIFSLRYIPRQAFEMLFKLWESKADFPYLVPNGFSSSILWSSPFLVLLARFGSHDKILKYAAWAAIFVLTFLLWMHGNSGGWQFGYRYAMVLLPWVFVVLLENSPEEITLFEWIVYVFSFLVNAFATYLFHWTDYVKP